MLRQGLLLDRASLQRTLALWSELAWLLQTVPYYLVRLGQVLAPLPLPHTPTYIGLVLGWEKMPRSLSQDAWKQARKWGPGQLQLQTLLQGSKRGSQCSLITVKDNGPEDPMDIRVVLAVCAPCPQLWDYQQGIYKIGTKVNIQTTHPNVPINGWEAYRMWFVHAVDYYSTVQRSKVLVDRKSVV